MQPRQANVAPDGRKILVTIPADEHLMAQLRELSPNLAVVSADNDADIAAEIGDATAVIGWHLSADMLARAKRLEWIHNAGAGVEGILRMPGFRERDILLTNSSGVSAPNMAEHAMAMMLAFARRLPWLQRSQEDRAWREDNALAGIFELTGQTVLIVGMGAIGRELARRAHAFDMHVISAHRHVSKDLPAGVDEEVAIEDLNAALARADHVVDTLPATQSTRGLFDASRFASMKRGAYFYNLGRGATVNQGDLIVALESGHLAGAGLDVTEPEPLPAGSPLWAMENVIITGHTSGRSPRQPERLAALVRENVRRYVAGEDLLNVVDQTHGY